MLLIRSLVKKLALPLATAISPCFCRASSAGIAPAAVYILMLRPLGLGDLMMLSPFVLAVAARMHPLPVHLVTEYPAFMDLRGVAWMHPDALDHERRRSGLLISPTLSWRHLKYLRGAGLYLGYFLSHHAISNITSTRVSYDARHAHYYQRAERLLPLLPDSRNDPPVEVVTYPSLLADDICGFQLPDRYVCMAPVANWQERQYPLERYLEIARHLACRIPVVLLGGDTPAEREWARQLQQVTGVVDLMGVTSLRQAVTVIARARLFLGNDSGLAHAAFLAGTPALVMFGCVSGAQRIPLDPSLAANVTELGSGNACLRFPCYDGFNQPRCRNRQRLICLRGVATETVLAEAAQLLGEAIAGATA